MDTNETILVIFGITGDLAQRKLLPALHRIIAAGLLPPARIIGVSRRQVSPAEVIPASLDGEAAQRLRDVLDIVSMDIADESAYATLATAIRAASASPATQVIFYLSVPPQASLPITEMLGRAGLNDKKTVKLLLEKPFGIDLASAQDSAERLGRYFDESQLYRIDHYLAKEMAQNIIVFRDRNPLFRSAWDARAIERIDIVAAEKIGIEGRAAFYEQTGALRDFLQNHLMQLAALTLLDLPAQGRMADLPARRLAALCQLQPIRPDHYDTLVRRGQYAGYRDEAASPHSTVETFVALTFFSDDPRWEGVPIRLVTGKQLAEQTTEIRIFFKDDHCDHDDANRLVLHVQPKEGFEMDLWVKKPGYDKTLERVPLAFDYRRQPAQPVEAYERVLIDAFQSDKSLFTTADEVLASWRLLEPIQEHWAMRSDDLMTYTPGTGIDDLLG